MAKDVATPPSGTPREFQFGTALHWSQRSLSPLLGDSARLFGASLGHPPAARGRGRAGPQRRAGRPGARLGFLPRPGSRPGAGRDAGPGGPSSRPYTLFNVEQAEGLVLPWQDRGAPVIFSAANCSWNPSAGAAARPSGSPWSVSTAACSPGLSFALISPATERRPGAPRPGVSSAVSWSAAGRSKRPWTVFPPPLAPAAFSTRKFTERSASRTSAIDAPPAPAS